MSGWLLFAFGVPTNLVALCHRSGLRATKKNPHNFYRKFDGLASERDEARRVVAALKSAGLSIKWIEAQDRDRPADAATIKSQTAKELRLAEEAYKRARESRRQAEELANREVYDRAKDALRRARGEDRPGDHSRRREPPAP